MPIQYLKVYVKNSNLKKKMWIVFIEKINSTFTCVGIAHFHKNLKFKMKEDFWLKVSEHKTKNSKLEKN